MYNQAICQYNNQQSNLQQKLKKQREKNQKRKLDESRENQVDKEDFIPLIVNIYKTNKVEKR